MKKYLAELAGTMVLVLLGCGAAVSLGCDNGAPATSGCHINPAINYVIYQCIGGELAAGVWKVIEPENKK